MNESGEPFPSEEQMGPSASAPVLSTGSTALSQLRMIPQLRVRTYLLGCLVDRLVQEGHDLSRSRRC